MSRSAIRAPCSGPGARPPERPLHNVHLAAPCRVLLAEQGGEIPRRAPPQSDGSGASSAICSRTAVISARSPSSAASRLTSAATDERARRLAAVSRSAVRTASESLSPSLRMTLSAATEVSSKRTCRERLMTHNVAQSMLRATPALSTTPSTPRPAAGISRTCTGHPVPKWTGSPVQTRPCDVGGGHRQGA